MKDGLIWKDQLTCLINQVMFFIHLIYIWEGSSEEREARTPAG